MTTIKLTAENTERYSMRQRECQDIANELHSAAHEITAMLHTMQCRAVSNESMTPAARVETVLQLQSLINPMINRAVAADRRLTMRD